MTEKLPQKPAFAIDRKIYALSVCAFLFLFCILTVMVKAGALESFDTVLFMAIHDYKSKLVRVSRYDEFMRDFTSLGGTALLTFFTSAIVLYFIRIKQNFNAVFMALTIITSSILSNSLKLFFDLPRPDLFPHGMLVHSATFPSGHTLIGTVTYLTLAFLITEHSVNAAHKAYIFGVAILISFLIGISRIYLGVHWPSDILAGWLLGLIWILLSWLIASFLKVNKEEHLYAWVKKFRRTRKSQG